MNRSQNNISLLLADDDKDDSALFTEAIISTNLPINLTAVTDGFELMELLNKPGTLFDIIVLDMNMPCKDGVECLKEIRTNERTRLIPVIAFSTSDYESKIRESLNAGATQYMIKPSTFLGLASTIQEMFSIAIASKGKLATDNETFLTSL